MPAGKSVILFMADCLEVRCGGHLLGTFRKHFRKRADCFIENNLTINEWRCTIDGIVWTVQCKRPLAGRPRMDPWDISLYKGNRKGGTALAWCHFSTLYLSKETARVGVQRLNMKLYKLEDLRRSADKYRVQVNPRDAENLEQLARLARGSKKKIYGY